MFGATIRTSPRAYRPLRTPWIAEFAARLRESWSVNPPEAIHAFGWMSGKAAGAARTAPLPVVQTFAALACGENARDGVALSEQTAVVRAAARVVATSSAQVFALLGLGASPAAIKLVPCGVDLGAFAPEPRSPQESSQRLRIGTLGDLGERGGVADVIEALAFVAGVELVIGGGSRAAAEILTDPDAARLHDLAIARGVAARVEFRGRIAEAEMPAFLRSMDIVVDAPRDDALGTVALAAMACGVPVIVSAVGGLIDAVADGMTGIHVPACAPRQLAYAIEALGADRSRRERFGRFGFERATARFGWSRIAAETIEIYRSVAACGKRFTRSPA
jgi:D-inositol-3-phosphate glycosyltransferase